MGVRTFLGLKKPYSERLARCFSALPDVGDLGPMALLVAAPSGAGKSVLARSLGLPTVHTDMILVDLAQGRYHDASMANDLIKTFGQNIGISLGCAGKSVARLGHTAEFAEIIAQKAPANAPLFCIEGEALRHGDLLERLTEALAKRDIRSWVVLPA